MVAPALFSRATDEWATPQEFFDELNAEFGFTLDVCATIHNAKCDIYIDRAADGLKLSWGFSQELREHGDVGAVWMNPPYGRVIGRWVEKARRTAEQGRTVVCLLPARTDTRWWHDHVIGGGAEVRFVRGRLKFGGAKNSAPFPSAVVIFRGKA